MVDFATKPGAPTGIDIIGGCLRRMGVTLRWGPTGLMLGDALTKDKAEAADLLRAGVRASAYQLADESSMLERAREEREARSSAKSDCKIRGHERRAADENVSGRAHRRGADRVVNHSSTGMYASELPGQGTVVRPSVKAGEGKSDAAARGEHGKLPDRDDGISGGPNAAHAGGPGERLRKIDAKRASRGHESVLASHPTLPRTADDLPKHEQSSAGFPRVQ